MPATKEAALGNQEAARELLSQTDVSRRAGSPATGFIISDNAAELAPGQMRKDDFLAALRTAIFAAADNALKSGGQSTDGYPYIESWIADYAARDAVEVEQAVRNFAPETILAQGARDYIPVLAARVLASAKHWARTGELMPFADDASTEMGSEESLPGRSRSGMARASRGRGLKLHRCATAPPKQGHEAASAGPYNWDAPSLTAILHKTADDSVVKTIVEEGYQIYRFDGIFQSSFQGRPGRRAGTQAPSRRKPS